MRIALQTLLRSLSFLVLPNYCLLCGIHPAVSGICAPCKTELPWQKHICPQCAVSMEVPMLCGECLRHERWFDQVIAPFCYAGTIQHLILQLKFHDRLINANLLGKLLLAHLQQQEKFCRPDFILPVPLHTARIRERGFNQALEIAKPLARCLKIPLKRHLLIKAYATPPQMEQDYAARQKNLKGSFFIKRNLQGAHVAILDDVVTTGSTVNEIARCLKRQGAQRVTVLAVARTAL